MSEVALLSFGCAVSFLVVAAVYIYVTEDFSRQKEYRKPRKNVAAVENGGISKAYVTPE